MPRNRRNHPIDHKPQIGSLLNGGSSFSQGLQVGAILNDGASGSNLAGPNTLVIKNILGRTNGAAVGSLGAPNWRGSPKGLAFQNTLSANVSSAIDFGALSGFSSFSNGLTVAVFAQWIPGQNRFTRIVDWAPVSSNTDQLVIAQNNAVNWQFYVRTTGGLQSLSVVPTRGVGTDNMELIVCSYDNKVMRLYLNGILKGTSTINQNISFNNAAHMYLGGWTADLGNNYTGLTTLYYVWNRVLTPTEIQQLYLDPYWALVPKLGQLIGALVPPPPPPTPSGGQDIPLIGNYAQSKSGFGINQKIIAIPEMSSFEEVRQVIARAVGELQNHIATQLPIIDYKQRKITNVAPPTEADDVVTLKYLQSVQLPAQPKSN